MLDLILEEHPEESKVKFQEGCRILFDNYPSFDNAADAAEGDE